MKSISVPPTASAANKKILFMNGSSRLVRSLWTAECDEKAACSGFQVDIPAREHDLPPEVWPRMLPEYDGVITGWGSPVCTAELLKCAPRLAIIGHAAGSAVAVTDASTYRTAVKVVTANKIMAETVSEWCMMMLLIAQRRLTRYAKFHAGERCDWSKNTDFPDLGNLVIGLWGMGDITRALLKKLSVFRTGAVLVSSGHAEAAEIQAAGGEKVAGFEELLQRSDLLVCLAGMTPGNCRKLDAARLALMKDGATVLNPGRARLIDNEALFREVRSGRLSAVLDVFEEEPLPPDSPWYALPGAILTPHSGAGCGRERYVPYILEQFRTFFSGGELSNCIDAARFRTMTWEQCGKTPVSSAGNENMIQPQGNCKH